MGRHGRNPDIAVYGNGAEPASIHERAPWPDIRIVRALGAAEVRVHREPYILDARPVAEPDGRRDDGASLPPTMNHAWLRLVPAPAGGGDGAFGLVGLHFPVGADHEGVAAWLTAYLERRFGSTPVVVRGVSAVRGGVSMYCGLPFEARSEAAREITRLVRAGAALAFAWFI